LQRSEGRFDDEGHMTSSLRDNEWGGYRCHCQMGWEQK
jgi:hypothetical protein